MPTYFEPKSLPGRRSAFGIPPPPSNDKIDTTHIKPLPGRRSAFSQPAAIPIDEPDTGYEKLVDMASKPGELYTAATAGTAAAVSDLWSSLGALVDATPGLDLGIGESMYKSGKSTGDRLRDMLPDDYKKAMEKQYATLNQKEAAYRDPRSLFMGILNVLPSFAGGAVVGAPVRGAALLAGAAPEVALATGTMVAGGALTAGDAASGAAESAYAANLPAAQRRKAERIAIAIGTPAGVVAGKFAEKILTKQTIGKIAGAIGGTAAGAGAEFSEETGTAFGTEAGKYSVGLGFDPWQILEGGLQGAVTGGPVGTVIGAASATGKPKPAPEVKPAATPPSRAGTAEQEALKAKLTEKEPEKETGLFEPTPGMTPEQVRQAEQFNTLTRASEIAERRARILGDQAKATLAVPKKQELEGLAKAELEKADNLKQQLEALKLPQSQAPLDPTNPDYDLEASVALDTATQDTQAAFGAMVGATNVEARKKAKTAYDNSRKRLMQLRALLSNRERELQSKSEEQRASITQPTEAAPLAAPEGAPGPTQQIPTEPTKPSLVETPTPEVRTTDPVPLSEPEVDMDGLAATLAANDIEGVRPAPANLVDLAVARSQRSKKAAETRARNKAAKAALQDTLSPDEGTNVTTPTVNSEAAAVRALVPSTPTPAEATSNAAPAPDATATSDSGTNAGTPVPPSSGGGSGAGAAALAVPANAPGPTRQIPGEAPTGATPAATGTVTEKPKPVMKGLDRSPRGTVAQLLTQGKQTADSVLTALHKAYKGDARHQDMITQLRKAFSSSKANPASVQVQQGTLPDGFQAQYDPKTDTITVDLAQAQDPVQAILHEVAHAATIGRIRTNANFKASIYRIMQDAAKQWKKQGILPAIDQVRGFRNPEEFVAEALSNNEFAQNLSALDEGRYTRWSVLKGRISTAFGFEPGTKAFNAFNQVLEFVNGPMFFDPRSAEEINNALDALGMGDVANLATTLATTLAPMPDKRSLGGRVRKWYLNWLGTDQIDVSFGKKGLVTSPDETMIYDIIGVNRKLIDQRDGFTAAKLSVATRVVDLFRQVNQKYGAEGLNDILHDARMLSLDPSLELGDPRNTVGINKPNGAEYLNELRERWAALQPEQQDVFRLIRDLATANRNEELNLLMVAQARVLYPNLDVADQLTSMINDASRATRSEYSGIVINGQARVKPEDISDMVSRLVEFGPTAAREELSKKLNDIYHALPDESGPFIPLRRYGDHMVTIYTEPVTETVSKARLDQMSAEEYKVTGDPEVDGTFLIISSRKNRDGTYTIKHQHKYVSSHDSEKESFKELERIKQKWNDRGRTYLKAQAAYKGNMTWESVGLSSPTLIALSNDVAKQLDSKEAGDHVRDLIMKYYLERMKDTSVGKSKMKAKKVQGASREMVRVFANYVHGNAHYQAQMRYGFQISRNLTTDSKAAQKILREQGTQEAMQQANDLQLLSEHLIERDRTQMKRANDFQQAGPGVKLWRLSSQLASAWLITGPGTVAVNLTQPIVMGLPHFSKNNNPATVMLEYAKAIKDLGPRGLAGTFTQFPRFVKGAAQVLIGRDPQSFRHPTKALFEQMIEGLDGDNAAQEKRVMKLLADRNKIEYGLAADLYAIGSDRKGVVGRIRSATDYLIEGSFGMTQSVEVANRTLTGLMSMRLNLAQNPHFLDEQLAELAGYDIDATQYNYAASNKPPAMQGEAQRGLFAFQTYTQNVTYMIGRNLWQLAKADGMSRAEAGKMLGGYIGLTMVSAGAMGVVSFTPIYLAGLGLMALMGVGDEDDWDFEQALRRWTSEWNQDLADLVIKGAPFVGGVDASRMGVPQALPIKDMLAAYIDPKADRSSISSFLGDKLAGPALAVGTDLWSGMGDVLNGNITKGLVKMTPKAMAVNDLVRMIDYGTEGIKTKSGDESMSPEDISYVDMMIRGFGFEPADIAKFKQTNRSYYVKTARVIAQRDTLIKSFGDAVFEQDQDTQNDILQDIVDFNDEHPGDAIKNRTLVSSIKNRQKTTGLVKQFGVPARTKGQQMTAREMQMVYGTGGFGNSGFGSRGG